MKKTPHINNLKLFSMALAASISLIPALISDSIASRTKSTSFWQTSHKVSESIKDDECLRPKSCFSTAMQYMKEEKKTKSAALFNKIRELYPYTTWRSRADYMLGRQLLPDEPAQAETFLKDALALSEISDYILIDLATSYRMQGKKDKALAAYDLLLGNNPESLLAGRAFIEKAGTLLEMNNCAEATILLEAYLKDYDDDDLTNEAAINLLRCATKTGHNGKVATYLSKYYHLLTPETDEEIKVILSRIDKAGIAIPRPTDNELFNRGRLFFDRGDYSKALEYFIPLAEADNYKAVLMSAKTLYKLKRYAGAESILRKHLSSGINESSSNKFSDAYLLLAKTAKRLGKESVLKEVQKKLMNISPGARETGEAMLLLGDYYINQDKSTKAYRIYKKTALNIEDEKIQAEALWKTGWLKYRKRDFKGARKSFSLYLNRYPEGINQDKFLYWKARTEEKLGNRRKARLDYIKLTDNKGKSYYRQIGRDRLAQLMRKKRVKHKPGRITNVERIPFTPSSKLLRNRNYMAAVELLLFGMQKEAMVELEVLLDEYSSDQTALANVIAMIYQMGEFYVTYQVVHKHFQHLFEDGGENTPLVVEKIAFPMKVLNYIKDRRLPGSANPFLIAAIMREESGFNPSALSPAGAMGLMQIMPATGKTLAKKTGNKSFDPDQLLDPDVSIRLGGLYLAQLSKRFKGNIVHTIASYNAGPTAVARWVREMKMDKDEFVESIPYRETRRYTKRVLRSYTEYLLLAGNAIPNIM